MERSMTPESRTMEESLFIRIQQARDPFRTHREWASTRHYSRLSTGQFLQGARAKYGRRHDQIIPYVET
eukprot:scaffold86320_cov34-Attheya_sp.AAC.2